MKYTLKLCIDSSDNELIERYISKSQDHNNHVRDNECPDSGFDIFVPEDMLMISYQPNFINFRLKCCMINNETERPVGFYMYPRSSISKTKLRLANCMGIIDSGYRGNLGGYFDVVNTQTNENVSKFHRLTQICSPTLEPFYVEIVENPHALGQTTRGEGGFGSTGTN